MAHIIIQATAMGFRVPVSPKGEIKGCHLYISSFTKRFEQWDKERDTGNWRLVNEFFYFDRTQEICYFPRYDLDHFLNMLTENKVTYDLQELVPVAGAPAPFLMLDHIQYKNDKQRGAVEYLTNPLSGKLRGLALQTGQGKSVSAIWALQKQGVRSIITMTSRLEQWASVFGQYTNLDEDDVYVIAGVPSLTKLYSQIDQTIFPKIILANTKTIRLYVDYAPSYQHLPHPSLMCEKLNIGIWSDDEMHEHFNTKMLIWIMQNPALFIPITATMTANDPFVKDVFDKFIPTEVRFTGGDYEKFVRVISYNYRSSFYIKPFNYMSPKGYSQQIFEKFLLGRGRKLLDNLMEDAILPIIKNDYINIAESGERFLFLCASQDMCNHVASVLKRAFPDKKISVFYSGMSTNVLERFDMIISTPGSAGTGRDISKLRTCFVFENSASETRNLQFIGRLRGPPQMMNEPRFVYLSLSNIPPHQKNNNIRAMLYGPRSLHFTHRSI